MPDIELTSAELDELERLAKAATPAREDEDDAAYWQHEIDVFDRVFAALSAMGRVKR